MEINRLQIFERIATVSSGTMGFVYSTRAIIRLATLRNLSIRCVRFATEKKQIKLTKMYSSG
jgi:hypothetical protein